MEGAGRGRYHPPMPAAATSQVQVPPLQGAGLRLPRYAAELVAALLAAVLYMPTIGYGFVFDDSALIGPDGLPVALGGLIPYRPLRYASYLIDGWLGGSPGIYHAHNIALHGVVAALVVALARQLGSRNLAALAGGVLVAVHPLAVEAVAYVAGRRDLLCTAFGVAALLAHRRLPLALTLLILSVAAKESGLVFVVPIAALSILRAGAGQRARSVVVAVGAAALVAVALIVAYGAIGPWHPAVDADALRRSGRVALHYLSGLFGQRELAPEYPWLLQSSGLLRHAASQLAAVVLFAATMAALAWCRRVRRVPGSPQAACMVSLWIASCACVLSLWGGLHEPGADRHAYLLLPALGVGLALLLTQLERAAGVTPFAAVATIAALLMSLAPPARSQMAMWQDERTLWAHAAAAGQPSTRVRANLARALAAGGELEAAAEQLKLAVVVAPDDPLLYLGRAALRCARRHGTRARRDLERARRLGAAAELVESIARDCPRAATADRA